jgi:hypothetical protein
MQGQIEAVGPQKQSTYGPYFGIKIGGVWYNVQGNRDESLKGQNVEYDVKDPNAKFKWAKIKTAPAPKAAASNGHQGLNQFTMADAFDFWWDKVKEITLSDEGKASVLCTLLIGTAEGKIHYEQLDEPPAPFDDSDQPPF